MMSFEYKELFEAVIKGVENIKRDMQATPIAKNMAYENLFNEIKYCLEDDLYFQSKLNDIRRHNNANPS